jgi:hypothetical protein
VRGRRLPRRPRRIAARLTPTPSVDAIAPLFLLTAETLVPALLVWVWLGRMEAPADCVAAFALAAAPVLTGIVVSLCAVNWSLGGWLAAGSALVILVGTVGAAHRRAMDFFRYRIVRVWAWSMVFWLGQEAVIRCHGRGFWAWDWQHHFEIGGVTLGLLRNGRFPFPAGRTGWLATLAAPAMAWAGDATFAAFQIATVFANATVLPACYLWGRRLGGDESAGLRVALAVICSASITQSLLFTWPKVLSAALTLVAVYVWAETRDQPAARRIGGEVVAALFLMAGFQAHELAAVYVAGLLLVCLRSPRRFPWVLAGIWCVLFAAWQWGKIYSVGMVTGFYQNPYMSSAEFSLRRQLQLLWQHLSTGMFPPAWWQQGEPMNYFLRSGSDYLLTAMPSGVWLCLLYALARRRGWHWRSADSLAAVSMLIASLVVLSVQPNAPHLGSAQGSYATGFIFLLCIGAAANTPWIIALIGALMNLIHYGVFRAPWLWLNARVPDDYNLAIKTSSHIRYLVDLYWQALPVGLGAMVLAAGLLTWEFCAVFRRHDALE